LFEILFEIFFLSKQTVLLLLLLLLLYRFLSCALT
jgi:hypothetical protein